MRRQTAVPRAVQLVMLMISVGFASGCREPSDQLNRSLGDPRYHEYGGMDHWMPPESLARMVEDSPIIVIASHGSVVDLGFHSLQTPLPLELVTPGAILPPVPGWDVAETTVTVKTVLKGHDAVAPEESISYQTAGSVPKGRAARKRDSQGPSPLMWPQGTEFILFLDQSKDDPQYHYVSYGRCGRVLTSGDTVTCSDAYRTRLIFMDDVGRDDFIAAIKAEIANPSDLPTEFPFWKPAPSATAIPHRREPIPTLPPGASEHPGPTPIGTLHPGQSPFGSEPMPSDTPEAANASATSAP